MTQRLFVFVDESGDPGYVMEEGASSSHYAELALQINEESWHYFVEHVISWKYVLGKFREFKAIPPRTEQLKRYVSPLIELHHRNALCCSCVYLIKANYTGPYLRPDSTQGQSAIKFRNFVHRKLLEYHFRCFPANDNKIELVFDQYRMNSEDTMNLEEYLNNNWNLPNFDYICHVNSIYSEAVQLTSQLLNAMKDIILGNADAHRKALLSFVRLKDISNP